MNGPGVLRLNDAVVIQGAAVADLAYLVRLGLRYRTQVDGCPPSEHHRRLLDALLAHASLMPIPPDSGSAELPQVRTPAESGIVDEEMGSETVARVLGITPRQVRNLAKHLGGRRVKSAWVFDRAAVSAEVARRSEGNSDV